MSAPAPTGIPPVPVPCPAGQTFDSMTGMCKSAIVPTVASAVGNTATSAVDTAVVAGTSLYTIILVLLGSIPLLIFHYGAAKLSFDTYGSYLWAFVDFLFPYLYYPFYAIVLKSSVSVGSSPAVFGGRRRK